MIKTVTLYLNKSDITGVESVSTFNASAMLRCTSVGVATVDIEFAPIKRDPEAEKKTEFERLQKVIEDAQKAQGEL